MYKKEFEGQNKVSTIQAGKRHVSIIENGLKMLKISKGEE